jgi:hypothetical protein
MLMLLRPVSWPPLERCNRARVWTIPWISHCEWLFTFAEYNKTAANEDPNIDWERTEAVDEFVNVTFRNFIGGPSRLKI